MQTAVANSAGPIRSLPFEEIFYLDPFEEVEGYHAFHTTHVQEDNYNG